MNKALILLLIIILLVIVVLLLFYTTDRSLSGIEDGLFLNENGTALSVLKQERREQLAASKYVDSDAHVLELGGRYGMISCVISKKLDNQIDDIRLVTMEPDITVQKALEGNLERNNCHGIVLNKYIGDKPKYIIKNGYSTHLSDNSAKGHEDLPEFTSIAEIQDMVGFKFDTLVADCEGCLEDVIRHCIEHKILHQFHTIIYEKDSPKRCNYRWIDEQLLQLPDMVKIHSGFLTTWKKNRN